MLEHTISTNIHQKGFMGRKWRFCVQMNRVYGCHTQNLWQPLTLRHSFLLPGFPQQPLQPQTIITTTRSC
ncbi:unnamed protein product [Ixodes pacificus]